MKIHIFEKGFNYSQDGPGNRLVYHLSGCNMKCPWCSNPEGMSEGGNVFDTQDIIKEIISCRPMFFDGGGVTFTGGECTLQADALCEIISSIRSFDINTAIESNALSENFLHISQMCDYVITDYKSPDAKKLKDVTGGNKQVIENNIRAAVRTKKVHIRIPLIHNFNDDDSSLTGFCEFFASLEGDFNVEILPYHEYGKEKWIKTGKEYAVSDGFVKKDTIEKFIKVFSSEGIEIIKT